MKRSLIKKEEQGGIDEHTLLLLKGDDSVTKDSSSYNRSIRNGSASLSSTGKFGNSIYLDGSGYKLRTDVSPFNFGSGDFTFDFWIKLNTTMNDRIIVNTGTVNTWSYGYQITTEGSGYIGIMFVCAPSVKAVHIKQSYSTLSSNFNHIAFVKKGSTIYAFFNGILQDTINQSSIPASAESYLSIGAHSPGRGGADCYIDEFRISNVARWTSDFTPPTTPYK